LYIASCNLLLPVAAGQWFERESSSCHLRSACSVCPQVKRLFITITFEPRCGLHLYVNFV